MGGWRYRTGVLASAVLIATTPAMSAAPTVAQMLMFKPAQKDVVYTTPTPAEQQQCKVELMYGKKRGSSGWVLKDPRGALLRNFFDSNADKYPDQWSYYRDGVECYREVDTNFNGKADRYMWLNNGGMRIGLDRNEDGTIDTWLALSLEELSQEVVRALADKDVARFRRLLISEVDLENLGAPAAERKRIRKLQKGIDQRFLETADRLSHLSDQTQWISVQTTAPGRLPADTTGMNRDVLMYYRALVSCETGGKPDWIQLGEIVLVGGAWKLLDSPKVADNQATTQPGMTAMRPHDRAGQEFLERLAKLDATAPKYVGFGEDALVARYHLERATLLEEILDQADDRDRGMWIRQLADSLSTAAQASPKGDDRALEKLKDLKARLKQEQPDSAETAYVAFRVLTSEYSAEVHRASNAAAMLDVQNRHVKRLAKFVADYPKAEDTADALLQLGMIQEFQNHEAEAVKSYEQLVRSFPGTSQAEKAQGALRRIRLVGKPWQLNAAVTSLSGPAFNMVQLRGKVVIVYYWATWCQTAEADFSKLKQLKQQHGEALEVVAINLDETRSDAEDFIRRVRPVGYQLYAGGGLESPVATYYGLVVFPNIFVVGRDGNVVARAVDINLVEEQVKKLIK